MKRIRSPNMTPFAGLLQTAKFSTIGPDGVEAAALFSLQTPPTQCDHRSFDSNSGTI